MHVSVHAIDEFRQGSKGKTSEVWAAPQIMVHRSDSLGVSVTMRGASFDLIGTGERGGMDGKDIHRRAEIQLDDAELAELLRALAREGLPKLASRDALTLASRLIESAQNQQS